MIKLLLTIGLVLSVLTLISNVVSDPFTAQIDAAIVYFLSFIHSLDSLFDTVAFITALQVFFNFLVSVALFWTINFVYSLIGGREPA